MEKTIQQQNQAFTYTLCTRRIVELEARVARARIHGTYTGANGVYTLIILTIVNRCKKKKNKQVSERFCLSGN